MRWSPIATRNTYGARYRREARPSPAACEWTTQSRSHTAGSTRFSRPSRLRRSRNLARKIIDSACTGTRKSARDGKIGAKVVHHARAVTFQLAEVAVPRDLFAALLARIGRMRVAPSPG